MSAAAKKDPTVAPGTPTGGGAHRFETHPHEMDPTGVYYVDGALDDLDELTLALDDVLHNSGENREEAGMRDIVRLVRSARGTLKLALELHIKPSRVPLQ